MVMKSYNERCEGNEEARSTVIAIAFMEKSPVILEVGSLLRSNPT